MKTIALIYHFILWGKRKSAANDLIYLEFLIRQNDGSDVSIKNIKEIIVEYRGRGDMDQGRLEKLNERFMDKIINKL